MKVTFKKVMFAIAYLTLVIQVNAGRMSDAPVGQVKHNRPCASHCVRKSGKKVFAVVESEKLKQKNTALKQENTNLRVRCARAEHQRHVTQAAARDAQASAHQTILQAQQCIAEANRISQASDNATQEMNRVIENLARMNDGLARDVEERDRALHILASRHNTLYQRCYLLEQALLVLAKNPLL